MRVPDSRTPTAPGAGGVWRVLAVSVVLTMVMALFARGVAWDARTGRLEVQRETGILFIPGYLRMFELLLHKPRD